MSAGVPKLNLRHRARFKANARASAVSAREPSVSENHAAMRAKSISVRQAQPLSARSSNAKSNFGRQQKQRRGNPMLDKVQRLRHEPSASSNHPARNGSAKPHTPTGRPAPHRMKSGRVREDVRNSGASTGPETDSPPEKQTSVEAQRPHRKGWAIVRQRLKNHHAIPRSSGFHAGSNRGHREEAHPTRKPSITLSDEVRRGNDEVNALRSRVSQLEEELSEKDLRLALAKKRARQTNPPAATQPSRAAAVSSAASIASKLSMGPNVKVVRDEEALRAVQCDRDKTAAELRALEARFRSLKQRSEQAESMLSQRVKRIAELEKQLKNNRETQISSINAKDECIAQLRAELELKEHQAKSFIANKQLSVENAAETQALREQVTLLAKNLHDERAKNVAKGEAQKEKEMQAKMISTKVSDRPSVENASELQEKMIAMKTALGAQKRRIAELEAKMRLQVSGAADKSSIQAKRFESALNLVKRELKQAKLDLAKAKKDIAKDASVKCSVNKLKTELNAKVTELSRATVSLDTLRKDLAAARAATSDNAKKDLLISALKSETDKLKKKLVEIEAQENAAILRSRVADEALAKANETLAVEQKMIETLRQKVHTLEQALKKAESQASNMAALKRDSDEYERRLRQAQAQASVEARKMNAITTEKETLAKHISELQKQLIDQKQRASESADEAAQVAKRCIEDLEKAHAVSLSDMQKARDAQLAEASNKARADEVEKLAAHMKSLKDNIKQLEGGLKEAHAALSKAETDKSEIELLCKAADERAQAATEHSKNMASLWQAERLRLEKKAVTDSAEAVAAAEASAKKTHDEEKRKFQVRINTAEACEAATRKDFERETATSSLLREKLAAANNQLKLNSLGIEELKKESEKKCNSLSEQLKAMQQLLHDVKAAAEREANDLRSKIKQLNDKIKSYADIERRLNATLKQVDMNNQACLRLRKERDAALSKAAEAKLCNNNEMQSKLDSLLSENKDLRKKLKDFQTQTKRETRNAEEAYQAKMEALIAKHASNLANIKTKLSVCRSDLKRAKEESEAAKKRHEQEIADGLRVFESDQNERLNQRTEELKMREAHHKRTISTQIERLKQLRKQLEDQKNASEKENATLRKTNDSLELKVKKLKATCTKLKREGTSQGELRQDAAEKLSKAREMVSVLRNMCGNLSEAVAAEAKGSGCLSNLTVLIKTGEAAQFQKKVTQLKKELQNAKKVHSVLMYNVKYGEKALAKFDKKAVAKQIKAREDSLKRLEQDIEESRQKEKRFQETSTNNVDELKDLKKDAQKKLVGARNERKKLTGDIGQKCEQVLEVLESDVFKANNK
eukprot:g4359.t1